MFNVELCRDSGLSRRSSMNTLYWKRLRAVLPVDKGAFINISDLEITSRIIYSLLQKIVNHATNFAAKINNIKERSARNVFLDWNEINNWCCFLRITKRLIYKCNIACTYALSKILNFQEYCRLFQIR